MRRGAFTLVELLVVIAILAVLMAMFVPSLSRAVMMGRATVCRNNLHQLDSAFGSSKVAKAWRTAGLRDSDKIYPRADNWPAVPADAVPAKRVYLCPEAEGKGVDLALEELEYVSPFQTSVTLSEMNTYWYISREGNDDAGASRGLTGRYREYLVQDDGDAPGTLNWHGWIDIDGLLRVYYEIGKLWVLDFIPSTPDFSGAYTPGGRPPSSCGDNNRLTFRGEYLLGGDKWSLHRGETVDLGASSSPTNYGISVSAWKYPHGTRHIVLLDYDELQAEHTDEVTMQGLLNEGARHDGRLNVLLGDGTVERMSPVRLNPQVSPKLWEPYPIRRAPP